MIHCLSLFDLYLSLSYLYLLLALSVNFSLLGLSFWLCFLACGYLSLAVPLSYSLPGFSLSIPAFLLISIAIALSLTCLSFYPSFSPRYTPLSLMADPELMIWLLTSWTLHQLVSSDWGFSESEHSTQTSWHWAPETPETLTPLSPGGWDRLRERQAVINV